MAEIYDAWTITCRNKWRERISFAFALLFKWPHRSPAHGNTEVIAVILWNRFSPSHHIDWENETHKAEYRRCADDILSRLDAGCRQ